MPRTDHAITVIEQAIIIVAFVPNSWKGSYIVVQITKLL